ncbi:MAG: ribosome-binding factor A [Candidatus Babeliales bacterium]
MTHPSVSDIKRAQKEKLFFREISQLLFQLNLDDPRTRGISLSRVSLSPDKSICTAYFYTPEGENFFNEILEILKLYRGSMRKALAGKIESRYVPELRFMFDDRYEKQAHLEELLDKVKSES